MPIHVRTVPLEELTTDEIGFWESCVPKSPDLTPFHSYRWLASWAAAYDATGVSFVLISEDKTGQPASLLPLMRWRAGLRSLSYNSSDYTGTVWTQSAEHGAGALAERLAEMAESEPVVLWNVRSVDPVVAILGSQNRLRLVARATVSSITMSELRFRPWNQLSPVSQKELKRKRERLLTAGMRLSFVSSVDSATLEQMFDIHTRAWQKRGEPGSFADPRRAAFVRHLVGCELHLLFALMHVGDRLVSYRFGPVDAGTYYDWNTGTDPEYARLSPGLVLLNALVERMFRSERVKTIDFLRGGEDYKRAWQTRENWVSEYAVTADRCSGEGEG